VVALLLYQRGDQSSKSNCGSLIRNSLALPVRPTGVNTEYQRLQLGVEKRFSHGVSVLSNWSISKLSKTTSPVGWIRRKHPGHFAD
jgi:hypothetical protein